ncbi:MAG: ACP S-malonyltransferase [Holosporales bacterium]|jgi:[acyl-carrier-protein] S-malonyltransferase|nr:ACP S-malonyltransferase [Holosporales bacterium]
MSNAFIFPGQGSQKVGMASSFMNGYKAGMEVMEEIEDSVGSKLSGLIEDGPIEKLTKTENAQLAIFAVSMMCVKILEIEYGYDLFKKCKYLAGHSLGEYSALCAAGTISISDAARLVYFRGKLMASAFPASGDCAMVALLGISVADIEELILQYQSGQNICVIANDNSDSQVVVSGNRLAVSDFVRKAKETTCVVKAIELNTNGPFHSPLMAKAAIKFDKKLSSDFTFSDFKIPVITNTLARPLTDKADIHGHLVKQMTDRVRWRESIKFMLDDPEIDKIIEIAPGRVLSTMLKRDSCDADVFSLETVSQVENFMKSE